MKLYRLMNAAHTVRWFMHGVQGGYPLNHQLLAYDKLVAAGAEIRL